VHRLPVANQLLDDIETVPVVLAIAADLRHIAMMDGNLERPPVTGGAPVMLYQVHTDHGDASLDADAFELVSTDRERRYKVRRPAAKQNQPTQKTTTHTHVNRKTHRA
jgi:hypothetical protein